MKKYEGQSVRVGKTNCGPIPNNVGFPKGGGGFVRTLTPMELKQQKANLASREGERF